MLLYLHTYRFAPISVPLIRPLFCVHIYYNHVDYCIALIKLCLLRSGHMAGKCIITSYIYSIINIEFILSNTKQIL